MRITLFFAILMLLPSLSHAEEIGTCKDLSGYANYHNTGVVPKKESGYKKDAITGSRLTLIRSGQNDYDIIFTDSRKEIISSKNDGGKVVLLVFGKSTATFMVYYPNIAVEMYTFYRDRDGREWYDLLQTKVGDGAVIHKSSLMTGTCTGLKFTTLP